MPEAAPPSPSRERDDAGIWVTLRQSSVPARAMLVGILVNRLAGFLQTFLVLFLAHRGFSTVQAGVALSCYGGGSLLGILVGGALADRLGPRLATLISMTGTAGLLLAVLYLTNYPAVLLAVTMAGLVAQLYRPAAATLLAELTPQHQQLMIFALYRLAVNVGSAAAPVLGVLLLTVSYDLLFWGEAIAALIYAAIAAVTLPRRPVGPRRPAGRRGVDQPGAARGSGYRELLRDRRFVLFLVAAFVNSVVYIQYISTLPLTMRDAGLATAWYGAVVSLNAIIVVTCELLVTKLVQRRPMRQLVAVGFVLLGAGVSIYALPWQPAVFIIGTLVWTMAEMIAGPTVSAYPGLVAPEGMRGRYIGAMQTAFNLGAAVGPAVGVALYHAIGINVWWCFGLTCLAGLVLALKGIRQPAARPVPTVDPAESVLPTGGNS